MLNCAVIFLSGPLEGYVRFDFNAMDSWFEDDDPIYIHPMDPHKQVDIRRSSRQIKVGINGVIVAESTWALHLLETLLPTRYYIPRTAVSGYEDAMGSATNSGRLTGIT